jgi:hypothetical protein
VCERVWTLCHILLEEMLKQKKRKYEKDLKPLNAIKFTIYIHKINEIKNLERQYSIGRPGSSSRLNSLDPFKFYRFLLSHNIFFLFIIFFFIVSVSSQANIQQTFEKTKGKLKLSFAILKNKIKYSLDLHIGFHFIFFSTKKGYLRKKN